MFGGAGEHEALAERLNTVMLHDLRQWLRLVESPATEAVVRTPKFQTWFHGSRVVDARGDPLLCYHGTKDDIEPAKFRPFSHFGSIGAAQDRLLTKKQTKNFPSGSSVLPVFLDIKHPIEVSDSDTHMTPDRIVIGAKVLPGDDLKRLLRLPKWRFPSEAARLLLAHGYDGFRYTNVVEDVGSTSWIILAPRQVWPLFDAHQHDEIATPQDYFAAVAARLGGSPDEAKRAVADRLRGVIDPEARIAKIMDPIGTGAILSRGNALRLQKPISDQFLFAQLARSRA